PLESIPARCAMGPPHLKRGGETAFRLAPPHRREVAFLRVPVRKVIVPVTHYLVHVATVHNARQAPHMLYEVTNDHGVRRTQFTVVDVAVQRLLHSEDE